MKDAIATLIATANATAKRTGKPLDVDKLSKSIAEIGRAFRRCQ